MISPDLLRRIDKVLGVPACWLATLASRVAAVARGWRRQPPGAGAGSDNGQPPRRVLIVQLAESGSMVLADPAMRWLADQGCIVYCLTLKRNRDSLSITGTIPPERILTLRSGLRGFVKDAFALRHKARAMGIEAVADLELFTRVSALLCWWSGISCRAGFHSVAGEGLYRGALFNRPVRFRPDNHMADNFLALAAAAVSRPVAHDRTTSLAPHAVAPLRPAVGRRPITAQDRQRLLDALTRDIPAIGMAREILLVNANASAMLPQRRWPAASFVALVRLLLAKRSTMAILLIGGDEDQPSNAAIAEEVADARCADIAGRVSLADLPVLFALARVMVSNDSGPAHFAAASDLPVVTLFGPETPVLYRPLGNALVISADLPCSPCVRASNQRRTGCRDNRCMQAIGVGEVFAATMALLDTHPVKAPADRENQPAGDLARQPA